MGNVKLDEDSREIFSERMYYQEGKKKNQVIYAPEDTVDSTANNENEINNNIETALDNKSRNAPAEKIKYKPPIKQPSEYVDKILYCKVCGKEFTFSKADQIEYDKKGWCEPNRCAKCERRKSLPSWIEI